MGTVFTAADDAYSGASVAGRVIAGCGYNDFRARQGMTRRHSSAAIRCGRWDHSDSPAAIAGPGQCPLRLKPGPRRRLRRAPAPLVVLRSTKRPQPPHPKTRVILRVYVGIFLGGLESTISMQATIKKANRGNLCITVLTFFTGAAITAWAIIEILHVNKDRTGRSLSDGGKSG